MSDQVPSNELLLHRLRTWNLGDIGRQAADVIDQLQQQLAPKICCGDFDDCRKQCIPLVDELRRRAAHEPRVGINGAGEILGCTCQMCEFHRSAEAIEQHRRATSTKESAP